MTTPVVPATPATRSRVVGVLAEAFVADPVVRWMIGDQRADERRLRAFFATLVTRRVVAAGGCDLVEGGAAVWFRPGSYVPDSPVATLLALPGLVRAFGPRLREAGEADAEMRRHHPDEPHWYLQFLGVQPALAGQGRGSALLRHRLAEVDAAGMPAYLETGTPRNLPLYERHGFEVLREVRLAEGAPTEWLMWRPAHSPQPRPAPPAAG
jgi:ribosomal protein S18 acetylase RimI-like enzyme